MPKMTSIILVNRMEQPTLSIRLRTPVENLPMVIGATYGKLGAYLEQIGELPSDVPYVAYYNMDMQDLDVEIGFPVAKALPGQGEIQAGFIPAGKAIFCLYRGPYQEIGPIYDEMAAWIKDQGYEPVGTAYEHYYNGPEFPPSELLTKVVMPLKD